MPKEKDSATTEGAMADLTSPREACQTNRDISHEREARDATLAKQVAKAVARKMAKAHAQYTDMIRFAHL